MTEAGVKLKELKQTLVDMENRLLRRKIDRQDDTIDGALDIINKASESGAIDISGCDGCDEPENEEGTGNDGGEGDGDA